MVKPSDKKLWCDFCAGMLNWFEEDNSLLDQIPFSDEVIFHLPNNVSYHMGVLKTHTSFLNMCDSPKLSVFCAVSQTQVYGQFFFADCIIPGWKKMASFCHVSYSLS
jgi:hypothetical protein